MPAQPMKIILVLSLALSVMLQVVSVDAFPASRDPLAWPFVQSSIWNMPIGSEAVYVPANIPPQKQVQPGLVVLNGR